MRTRAVRAQRTPSEPAGERRASAQAGARPKRLAATQHTNTQYTRHTNTSIPQASSFQAAGVVSTLKRALLDDPTTNTLAFSSEDQVLAYLGNRAVTPVFTDPVCGDGRCEAPYEFPAWGPFGCRADCGAQPIVTNVVVSVAGDFVGHATISPRVLMEGVRWNLCRDDAARRDRGETDLCWWVDVTARCGWGVGVRACGRNGRAARMDCDAFVARVHVCTLHCRWWRMCP